jgi:large subunit ribosomal protein L7/L12
MNLNDKLAALQQRRQEIDNQVKLLEAREKEQARKDDSRRKIIAGALALEHLTKNPESEFGKVMARLLDEYVETRNRALFPFLPEKKKAERGAGGAA